MEMFVETKVRLHTKKAETWNRLLEMTEELFPEKAYVYAVMDYAVAFGLYEGQQFKLGVGDQKSEEPLKWEYVQELRVFDREKELYLQRQGNGLFGRLLMEKGTETQTNKGTEAQNLLLLDSAEETQKLWGSISGEGIPGWGLLQSGRGTKIQLPLIKIDWNHQLGKEYGLKIRRYFQTDEESGSILLKDVRILEICDWRKQSEKLLEEGEKCYGVSRE